MSPKQTLANKLLLHGGIYAVARFVERAAGLILVPIYARVLRDHGYGVVALLGSVTPFLTVVFGQGLPAAWFRLRHDYEGDEERRIFETTIVWYLVGSGLLLLLLFSAMGEAVAALLLDDLAFFPLVFLTAVTGALQVHSDLFVRRANAEQRPMAVVAFSLPRTFCMLTGVFIGVAVLDLGPLGKLGADAAVALVFAIVSWLLLRPASPTRASGAILRRSLAFGLPLVPHALATQVNAMVGRILISGVLGLAATGVYSMGAAIADVGSMIAVSFNRGFSPLFISEVKRLESEGQDSVVRGATERSLARTGLLMVAAVSSVALGVTVFAREALLLLTTEQFSQSYRVVAPLAAATVLRSSYFAFSQPLFTNSVAIRRMPIVSFVGTAVNIVAHLVLLPRMGFAGGAFALLAANGAMAALALFMGQAILGLPHSAVRWAGLYGSAMGGLAGLHMIDGSVDALLPRVVTKSCVAGGAVLLSLAAAGTSPVALLRFLRDRRPGRP